MDIGDALDLLKSDYAVTRKGWDGRGQYLKSQRPRTLAGITDRYSGIRLGNTHR